MTHLITALLLLGLGIVLLGVRQPKHARTPYFVVGGFSLFLGAGAIYLGVK